MVYKILTQKPVSLVSFVSPSRETNTATASVPLVTKYESQTDLLLFI